MSGAGAAKGAAADSAGGGGSYVGLVRGINVGVGNRIPMADFRAVFEGLGFADVKTLLQSGNVVFDAARDLTLADVAAIEEAFAARAGFRAGFVVLGTGQFLEILDANPLLDVATDPSRLVVTFLPQAPDARGGASRTPGPRTADPRAAGPLAAIALPDADSTLPEVLATGPHAVYSWHPDGISNSRLPASFWKQLGPVYTARNLNTANKIAALLRGRSTS
ncbi:DUF1697 domain-containing protein [Subtercola boreus]|uniref:DUF1697 domain-containing protein n=1 Tax=Subtercola boreus TaxID=120213 RepID=A0A3E0WE62_9MICO|nr:DUF1697 domain-containing protein [Subtercola boreus]RFA22083.1 hypothetical protein B7R24_05195 [Subtercola boreus]RFA22263.1 hypothetical protein B7R23_05140 [Subtercola boreus]RFA28126.1 hypothetical protein B7R25_05265 [Subtercola boreus]